MAIISIRNENWRDEVSKYAYPFDERSTLETPELYIGTDLVLDAALYFKEPTTLPIYLSAVNGTDHATEVTFEISGGDGQVLGTTTVAATTEVAEVYSPKGYFVGLLVLYPAGVTRFLNNFPGRIIQLLPEVATFSVDVVHVSTVPSLRFVEAAGTTLSGTVKLVARHGCEFALVDGQVRLHIKGIPLSDVTGKQPILSLNHVPGRTLWLAAAPRLNLRVDTQESGITFVHVQDAK